MSLQDSLFSEDVENDVTLFTSDAKRKRDPKVNGGQSKISSATKLSDSACAMGVEGQRSLSVSPEHSRQRQVKSVPTVEIYRPPAARRPKTETIVETQPADTPTTEISTGVKSTRQRRPDRAVYVPRHRRSNEAEGSPLPQEPSRPVRSTRHSTPKSTASPVVNELEQNHKVQSTESFKKEVEPRSSTRHRETTNVDHNFECNEEKKRDRPTESKCKQMKESNEDYRQSSSSKIDKEEISEQDSVREKSISGVSNLEKSQQEAVPTITENLEHIQRTCIESAPEVCERISEALILNAEREQEERLSVCETADPSLIVESDVINSETIKNPISIERNNGVSEIKTTVIMSSNVKKDRKAEEDLINREDVVNRKNRRIVRQNVVSDVLIISENERKTEVVRKETPVVVPVLSVEKKVKKIERPKSKPASPPSPPLKVNRDECDWDSLFDDNGECLDPTLIEELTSAVGEVSIEQPKNDYKPYTRPVEVSNDEFAHVVEIYNFPSDFKTSDLAAVFSPFKNGGFELKWVDDTHCLGVFSSPLIAAEVLASDHPFVKTRSLSEATALSKTKARRSAEFLQPYRTRPETCAAIARRLVTGALGVRLATAREEREREKIVLQEAKEKRRLAKKQREDAWEGVIADK
ncbi:uncharacterized protein LOC107271660 isoform X2 [Cephus cinctus]|uniref:Uncharacterized protein LOC107271660 isoform X2 n=1 Tax=Cephus cinctus TaxID=211228 RepID=A0AAJ7FQK6_CEPCN|nr:uncharacterized protein LOC107271660 isoform X2 [Cephus cinctus]